MPLRRLGKESARVAPDGRKRPGGGGGSDIAAKEGPASGMQGSLDFAGEPFQVGLRGEGGLSAVRRRN